MTEILLFLTSVLFLTYHAWYVKQNQEQIKILTKAVLSKDLIDFTNSELRVKTSKKKKEIPEKLIEERDLSDEEFDKMIKNQVKE